MISPETRTEIVSLLGSDTAARVHMKYMDEFWFMRWLLVLFPWWMKRVGAITLFGTFYVKRASWHQYTPEFQKSLILHESVHIRQGMRFPVIHQVTNLVGSPWILGAFLPFVMPEWYGWVIGSACLLLSFTGILFPHMRAWWEYEAYSMTDRYVYSHDNLEQYVNRGHIIFGGFTYLFMGGFLTGHIVRKLVSKL